MRPAPVRRNGGTLVLIAAAWALLTYLSRVFA